PDGLAGLVERLVRHDVGPPRRRGLEERVDRGLHAALLVGRRERLDHRGVGGRRGLGGGRVRGRGGRAAQEGGGGAPEGGDGGRFGVGRLGAAGARQAEEQGAGDMTVVHEGLRRV